ncbi:MAG: hypothetical protein HYU81_00935 [Candidatus Brennerbacteria bacterium]|nr:hypothetical protein [Candidatus Brennerbacteria bacterium]
MTTKIVTALTLGFVVGVLVGVFLIQKDPSAQVGTQEDVAMLRFLVNMEKGQAKPFDDLELGTYRIGALVDDYTMVLIQPVPKGHIPILVRNVPLHAIRNGFVYKYYPFEPS